MSADERRNLSLLAVVGGALLVVGSFMPWVKIDVPIIGTISRTGMNDGEGIITVVIGAVAVGIALQILRGNGVRWIVSLIITGALGGAITAVFYSGITAIFHYTSQDSFGLVSTSYGMGLVVIAVGVALVLLASIRMEMLRQRAVDAAAAAVTPPPAF